MNNPEYTLHSFPNGIRWVHKQVKNTKIAHCGIMLDIGSRDEKTDELGLAHFWEHMAFKGTKTKNATYIINRIDNLGGELNAYTTKEKICFHSSLLVKHIEKAIELLVDITFNSTFPEKEINKERQVILEEMSMYEDDPEDAIQDDFEGLIFENSSMGNNILGTKESVSRFTQKDFLKFISANMNTNRTIISTVGGISFVKTFKVIEKYVSKISVIENKTFRKPIGETKTIQKIVQKPINQAHCMIGRKTYSLADEKRLPFFMLTNMLGGQAMNSKLNVALREKQGLVYTVDAQYSPYMDTGMFNIYFGCEKKNIKKSTELVMQELQKLCKNTISSKQLLIIKNQLKGQLAVAEENNNGMMMLLAKNILDFGYVENLDTIFKKIDAVGAADLQAIALEMFDITQMSSLIYEPIKK